MTGGSGLLGRAVARAAGAAGWRVVAPAHREVDVLDAAAVEAAVAAARPRAVLHAAYLRDGPRSREVIVDGSAVVARAAARAGARLVHMSTDVVFPGRPEPYTEDDTPDPVHEYGRAKLAAEREVTLAHPGAVMVRTSLLYGDAASPPVRMVLDALDGRGPGRDGFFTDEVRTFAHVDDVAAAVLALAAVDVAGPLHVAGPEPLSRHEFAVAVCRAYGRDPGVVRAARAADVAPGRPLRVVLDSSRARAYAPPPGAVADRLRPA